MLITTETIDEAEREGACEPAIEWLRARPRTVAELCEHDARWALWAVANGFAHLATPEQINECAEQRPGLALMDAAAHLTPSRLDRCAEQRPGGALRYASAHLTPSRLDGCAEKWPGLALMYAAALITPERRAWCEARVGPLRSKS